MKYNMLIIRLADNKFKQFYYKVFRGYKFSQEISP